MAEAMEELVRRLDQNTPTAGPVLFTCRHRVYGVGMFDVSTVLEGDTVVARAGAAVEPTDVLVGTISSCHGAASLLHLGPPVSSAAHRKTLPTQGIRAYACRPWWAFRSGARRLAACAAAAATRGCGNPERTILSNHTTGMR